MSDASELAALTQAGPEPLPDAGPQTVDVVPSVGERLRAQRELKGLSREDVAGQMKVTPRRIEALEAGQWESLPQGPYLRGFVRNYAKTIGADANALCAEIESRFGNSQSAADQLRPLQSLHTPFPQRDGMAGAGRGALLLMVAALLLVLLAGLVYWSGTESYRQTRALVSVWIAAMKTPVPAAALPAAPPEYPLAGGPAGASTPAVATVPAAFSAPPSSDNANDSAAPENDRTSTGVVSTASAVLPAPRVAAAPASSEVAAKPAVEHLGEAPLVLHFVDRSWVEVKQADGKVLLSQLADANTEQALTGQAPFAVVIGNAPVVKLEYHGAAVDLTPYIHDNVARLTLK